MKSTQKETESFNWRLYVSSRTYVVLIYILKKYLFCISTKKLFQTTSAQQTPAIKSTLDI